MRVASLVLLVSCAHHRPPPRVIEPSEPPPAAGETAVPPSGGEQKAQEVAPPARTYALEEAVADALSAPLTHVGTGAWYGLERVHACVYKNDKVFVVNVYCTPKEMPAFGLVVLSPQKGRAYIYAEAKKPVSTAKRGEYFTFRGEVQPALVDAKLPALELGFSVDQLRAWDEKRYKRFPPSCGAGTEMNKPMDAGCTGDLKPHADAWTSRNKAFLDEPPHDWYKLVNELRTRAKKDGQAVKNAGG